MARSPPFAEHGSAGIDNVRKGESPYMTVQNQNVKNVYRGNGSTTVFPFTFAINESHPEYIHVYITNDGGKAAETTDFTCDMETRTITYPKVSSSAPKLSATQRLTIYRLLPYEQNLNLVNQGPFFSEDVETQLDDLEMQIQQLSENLVRCFQLGIEALDFDMTMELEPGKVICVNSDGNGFEAREALMEVNGAWDGEGRRIESVADPAAAQDAVTKNYVDTLTDNNFMKLQPDGTAWEARNLPISNVAGPALVKDAANKDYVDRILAGYSGYGERLAIFDNVPQMQEAELVPSQVAVTLGYWDVNDGGAGVYTIRDKGTDTPDGGSIIEIPGTDYVAKLITPDFYITKKTFYLKYYDSDRDGDLSTFIRTKLAEGYMRFLVPDGFVLNDTLIIEGIRNGVGTYPAFTLEGEFVTSHSPANIILNTGGKGIELRETQRVLLKNLFLDSRSATNPSTIGIVMTRDTVHYGGSSEGNVLDNVIIKMHSDFTANNGNGTIGIYADTAEETTYKDLSVRADVAMLLTIRDNLDICPYNSIKNTNKDHYFIGKNVLLCYGTDSKARALWVDGASGITGTIYLGDASEERLGTGLYISKELQSANVSLDIEKCTYGIYVADYLITSKFSFNINGVNNGIYVNGGLMLNCIIDGYYTGKRDATSVYLTVNSGHCDNNIIMPGIIGNGSTVKAVVNGSTSYFIGNQIISIVNFKIENSSGYVYSNTMLTTAGWFFNSRRICSNFGTPSNNYGIAFASGDFFHNTQASVGNPAGYIYSSEGNEFKTVGQIGYRTLTTPSTVTPKKLGEIAFDSSGNAYIAIGTSAGDFKRISQNYQSAAPSSGSHAVGEIVYNSTPTADGYVGWVCVTAGTPGTWKGFGKIEA